MAAKALTARERVERIHDKHALGFERASMARDAQRLSGKRFGGSPYLTATQEKVIQDFLSTDSVARSLFKALPDIKPHAEKLLLLFEEMCRRNEVPWKKSKATFDSYRLVLNEFYINVSELQISPARVMAATIHYVSPVALIPTERGFAAVRDKKWLINYAIDECGGKARDHLRNAIRIVRELSVDDEFSDFRKTPHVYWLAASLHQSDARGYLREVKAAMARIRSNPEFADISDNRKAVEEPSIKNPKKAEDYLRAQRKMVLDLCREPCYSHLGELKDLFRELMLDRPNNVRKAFLSFHRAVQYVVRNDGPDKEGRADPQYGAQITFSRLNLILTAARKLGLSPNIRPYHFRHVIGLHEQAEECDRLLKTTVAHIARVHECTPAEAYMKGNINSFRTSFTEVVDGRKMTVYPAAIAQRFDRDRQKIWDHYLVSVHRIKNIA